MSVWLERGNIEIIEDSLKIDLDRNFLSDKSIYSSINKFTKDNYVSFQFDSENNVLTVFITPKEKKDLASIAYEFNKSIVNSESHGFIPQNNKKPPKRKSLKRVFLKD